MLALARQTLEIIEILDIQLVLRVAQLVLRPSQTVRPRLHSDPRHTDDVVVDHETEGVGQVRLVGHRLKSVFVPSGVIK